MVQLIGSFVSAANELTAQHSSTWLVLAVAVAASFRNPPPSPAPPVLICYGVTRVCYMGLFYICYVQQHVVEILAVASPDTCSAATAAQHIYFAKTKHINTAMYITMPIPHLQGLWDDQL